MDPRFAPHNLHRKSLNALLEFDPQLARLGELSLVHWSEIIDQLPRDVPGVYTLTGGRQVGKTTLVKQWMSKLLQDGVAPDCVYFVTGELVDDHHSLIRLFLEWRETLSSRSFAYFILDEVTYVGNWDQGIKYLADAGLLDATAVVLTGSDLTMIREARVRLPGRRGESQVVDFHLHPLTFRQVTLLKNRLSSEELRLCRHTDATVSETVVEQLFDEFDSYLVHGGYLTAMNDIALTGRIRSATLRTYSDWIRGDMLKRGKREHFLREVLGAVVKRHGSQVSFNALARDLSIDHPATVADYIGLLRQMDAIFVRHALREDRLAGAPKKARKVDFCDPFILHAIRTWLSSPKDPFEAILAANGDSELVSHLVESVAATHLARLHPTFYIKAEGEVDAAWVHGQVFYPVEVKWTRQSRPKDLKQIGKYPNGVIWDRRKSSGMIHGIPTVPLPLALLRLDA